MSDNNKICINCQEEKPLSAFNKSAKSKDGKYIKCRDCQRDYQKQYYIKNRQRALELQGKKRKRTKDRNQEFVYKILSNSNCVDCGCGDFRVLEFDHLPEHEKKHNISNILHHGYSLEVIKEEISKCEVVCANCHRIRTHERAQTGRFAYFTKSC